MKTERAIELLNRISDSQFDGIHGDERREALEMAVRALEQNLVKESGDLVQDLVNDCISRKMAIEAFEPEHDTDWYTPRIIEVLEALPPVQPMQTNADSTQTNTLDCVSRRAAMIVIENSGLDDDSKDTVVRVLEQLPSAQPQRKKGKWIDYTDEGYVECPFCHSATNCDGNKDELHFCFSCGADMRGENDA